MAITVTSLDQRVIANNGGHKIVINGVFTVGSAHRIYIGATGTIADAECWSGKAGQGHDVYPISDTLLICYSPILPAYGPYSVLVRVPATGDTDVLAAAITTIPQDYKIETLNLRQLFPPTYSAGVRKIEDAVPLEDWS